MNDQYLMDIILNFSLTGKDSSSNTLSWFFYMLCKYRDIQDKVMSKIEEHIGYQVNETKVENFVELITDEVLERMHYLRAGHIPRLIKNLEAISL
ncbi:cytochrome P450 704C1-like protein [Tanacetum coccineum]